MLQLFLVPAFWGWLCCVTGPNKSSNLCTTLPPLARHTNSPVTDCLYTIQSTLVTICVPALFSTECMEFVPTTFRIKTNYFCKRDVSLFQRIKTGFWSHPARYSVGTETASPGDYPLIRSRCYKQADNPWLCREMKPGFAFLSESLH